MSETHYGSGRQNFQSDLKWWKNVGLILDFFLWLGIPWELIKIAGRSPQKVLSAMELILNAKMLS